MIQKEHLGISPIPQLIRRYISSGKDISIFAGVSEQELLEGLKEYKSNIDVENIDRLYDSLSVNELETIFKIKKKDNYAMQDGKKGLDDCMQDDMVRSSIEQEATKIVKEIVQNKEKVLIENEQQK